MPGKETIAMRNEYDYLNDVKMDFNCYEQETISEKELTVMKKNIIKPKKIFIAAACIVILTTTAFATGLVGNIIKTISTGYNSFTQIDPNAPHPVPDELKGKIFDEDGNPLDTLSKSGNMYNKDGLKITGEMYAKMLEDAHGTDIIVSYDGPSEDSEVTFQTLEEAERNAVFDVKVPEYLPEGYSVSKIYAYKNDDGTCSGEYLNIVYKNADDKEIIIHERILNENTAFEAGTDGSLEDLTINGRKTVIMHDTSLHFETKDAVSVSINTKGNIPKAELIKMAESIAA